MPSEAVSLSDLAVLVTGAGRGLGRSVVETLARRGAAVGAIDIDAPGCSETAAQIRKQGGSVWSYTADVSDRSAFAAAAANALRSDTSTV